MSNSYLVDVRTRPLGVARSRARVSGASTAEALVWLLVFSVPIESAWVFPAFGSLSRVLGLVAALAVGLAVIRRGSMRALLPVHALIFAYLAWVVMSTLWSLDLARTMERIQTLFQLILATWLIWETVKDDRTRDHLLQAFVLGTIVSAAITLFHFFNGNFATMAYSVERYGALGRDLNELALTTAMGIPVAVYLSRQGSRLRRGVNQLAIPLLVVAVLLTGSRGGFLAMAVGLLLLLVLSKAYRKLRDPRILLIPLVAAVTIVGAIQVVPTDMWTRLSEISTLIRSGDMGNRGEIWSAALEAARQRPILGVGAGAFPAGVGRRDGPNDRKVAHNILLSIQAETGVVGVTLFLFLLVGAYARTRHAKEDYRHMALAWCATWGVGSLALSWEYSKTTWLLIAILLVSAHHRRRPVG